MRVTALPLLMALAGCQVAPQLPEVREVKVIISVPCVKREELPAAPKTASNAELSAMGDYDLVLTIAAERLDLLKLTGEQAALLKGCAQ